MADPQQLTFLAWCRPEISTHITGRQGGRAVAVAEIKLTELDAAGTELQTRSPSVSFLVAGPADVAGLLPAAIVRRYPAPHTADHESDRCPYIELADHTLPWRYTPAPNPASTSPALHPWLVLLTGTPDELVIDNGMVTVSVSAQQDPQTVGAPTDQYRFAHVQEDAARHRTSRILSARLLQAGSDYLAVVVPAYDSTGAPAWRGTDPVTLPVYDSWPFHTAEPAGSFEDLAALLEPGPAPDTTGHTTVAYPRLASTPQLDTLGALVARTPSGTVIEEQLPGPVALDLKNLRNTPPTDPEGRQSVALPRYGQAWSDRAPDTTWGETLNADPRHRGAAGLGLEIGIRRQEDLVADALNHLGDLRESRQRIRHLAIGVEASRALWRRRTPSDDVARLWLLGPALNRLVTAAGPVGQLATAADRTVARGTFSAAARRVLRAGPVRTGPTPRPAATLLASANRPAPAIPDRTAGLPFDTTTLDILDAAAQSGSIDPGRLSDAIDELAANTAQPLSGHANEMVTAAHRAADAGDPVPWASLLTVLADSDPATLDRRADPAQAAEDVRHEMVALLNDVSAGRVDTDLADLTPLLGALGPLRVNDPAERPLDLDALAAGVSAAFDPTLAVPPAAARVLATITGGEHGGIDPDAPLAPPEPCVGLDRPVWADLAEEFGDWLLPGVTGLNDRAVAALQTNPRFIDAFLVGLNTQLLSELRWRNIPIATGCTPLRRFWDRADTATGARADDITDVTSWVAGSAAAGSALGDVSHRPPGATGRELVIVVRGELLRRYPTTLVYLRSAVHPPASTADFHADPDATLPRLLPAFRGRLGDDVVFFGFPALEYTDLELHWLVLEEPPAGYRFANDPQTETAGHRWAAAALAQPVRVLIRGNSLTTATNPTPTPPGGNP